MYQSIRREELILKPKVDRDQWLISNLSKFNPKPESVTTEIVLLDQL